MVPSAVKKPLTGCSCAGVRGLLIRIFGSELRHHDQVRRSLVPERARRTGIRDRARAPLVVAREARAHPGPRVPGYAARRTASSGLPAPNKQGAASPRPLVAFYVSGLSN